MLNLAMSDSIRGGWPLCKISTLPGQSGSGKTALLLSTFTEACLNPKFDDYDLIFDDIERRCDFNFYKLFPPLLDRLTTPSGLLYKDLETQPENTGISRTIQDLRKRMLLLKKKGRSFIYIADSLDSLSTNEEMIKEMKRATAKTEEAAAKIAGSYGEKAKILGQILRLINDVIADTKSGFILTQQLRMKMDAHKFESPYITSGGQPPIFYSHVRPFLIKKESYKNNGCKIGGKTFCRMDKNSTTGKLRDVEFDIYYDLGIDDNASMVSFLLSEKHWKSGSWITAPEFDIKENGKTALIRKIEELGGEQKLKRIVQKVWNNREESLLLNRKPRY